MPRIQRCSPVDLQSEELGQSVVVPPSVSGGRWKSTAERVLDRVPSKDLPFAIACGTLLAIVALGSERPLELSYAALSTLAFLTTVGPWLTRRRHGHDEED